MKKSIIAFGYVSLSDHWASLFYLDKLHNAKFNVVYLNIDKISIQQYNDIVNDSTYLEQIVINDINEFEEIVKKSKDNSIFYPNVTIIPRTWKFFKILIKNKAHVYFSHLGELPPLNNGLSVVNIKLKLRKIFSKILIEKVLFHFRKRIISSNLKGVFVAGSVAENYHRKNGCKNIINVNVRDWDNFLEQKDAYSNSWQNKYCLFIDSYLPFHPDNLRANLFIEPDCYYKSMNDFFDYFENKYNLEIIVAAHPKSQYDLIGNRFNNRKIVKGQTGKLVQHSEFVLNHDSSSLNYALLYGKKIIFLTTNFINDNTGWFAWKIKALGDLLGCPVVNIDSDEEVNNCDFCDHKFSISKYDDYKFKYLTSEGTRNRCSGDIILHEIEQAFIFNTLTLQRQL